MKRRNFLAALFALPFAVKMRETPIGLQIEKDIDFWPEELRAYLVFPDHRERIKANAEYIERMTRALLKNAPARFETTGGTYDITRQDLA